MATVGLVVAAFLGFKIGATNYTPVALLAALAVSVWLVFFTGDYFWLIMIAASSLAGTFPVLGGSFTPFQLLMAIGVIKFVAEDVVLKRRRLATGPSFDRIMILGFMAILTIHGLHDRFGMRFLGSSVWGGRNYVNIYLALAAYFVIQTIPIDAKVWRKLPYFVLAVASFDLTISLITTIFPASIYAIYPFYSAVSRTGIEEIVTGGPADEARLGAVGNFGLVVIAIVFASTSVRSIFAPRNFWRFSAVGFGFVAALFSSFRTSVFNVLAAFVVAGFRDLKAKVLLFLPVLAGVLAALAIINSQFFALPKTVQRSLTFMPGKWDPDMAIDAADSNEWRGEIWDIWLHDYFPAHPLLGRGFGFRSEWAAPSALHYRPEDNRAAVEVGNVHNGLYSALDTFGIIGMLFFLAWCVGLVVRVFSLPFRPANPTNTVLWFVAIGIASSILCYWLSAQIAGTFIAQQLVASSVLLRLRDTFASASTEEHNIKTKEHFPALVPARG